jgi:4-amino-4-deoxy-L-arabinose transferase-like glycosyltransferase
MSRRTLILLSLIWLTFLIRGTFYSILIPIWEGMDEYSHFDFVEYLTLGNGLPAPDHHISAEISQSLKLAPAPTTLSYLSLTTHDDFWQLPEFERAKRADALKIIPENMQRESGAERMLESKQPPLYYWLATAALWRFRNSGLIDRVFLARLFSVLIASSVVFLSFIAAKLYFGDEQSAVQAAALITAMPQLFISVSRVSNEPLSIAIFSVLTCCLILAVKGNNTAFLCAEFALGLGLLTKAYFVAAVPAVAATALLILWRSKKNVRSQVFFRFAAIGVASLSLCLWWYLRNLQPGNAPIWEDAAPVVGGSGDSFFRSLLTMQWYRAIDFTMYSHVWLGGWSFLSLRSWIYHGFMYGLLAGLAGIAFFLLRNVWKRKAGLDETMVLSLLYAGFWASLIYHAFVSFSKGKQPASGGWYLYAAIVPETLIVIFGLWQFMPEAWRRNLLVSMTAAFVLLDLYSSHFVALPYYTGLIRHSPNNSLQVFHISDAAALGTHELLSRLLINRPAIFGPTLLLAIWGSFIILSVALPFIITLNRKTR